MSNSDAMLDLLKFSFTVIDPQYVHTNAGAADIIKSAADAIDIAKGVQSDNFGQASNATILFTTDVLGQNGAPYIKTLKDILAFANDVVAAKTAADIKTVIENYAAPVQSYQAVRKSKVSFTLASYPGIYAGTEHSKQNGVKLFSSGTFGVTSPVGFALNFGSAQRDLCSYSIFVSMIDIGAALSYRFNNTSSDIPDKITLGQIFSPGIHGVIGIKNSPLAVKVGYQYAPELRQISNDKVNVNDGGVSRLSIGLSVDIPIFFLAGQAAALNEPL
ncbi:hypothetical protein [Mucilaginibacter sp.]|uniref:hypothetical protein n=1 Tax=Mucilaginibacter sp. TaxID=1882438 RepID=UPI002ED24C8C